MQNTAAIAVQTITEHITMLPGPAWSWPSESLVPLGLAAVATVLLMSSLRRRQRRAAGQPARESSVRNPATPINEQQRIRRDMESLLGELQDLARRISAEIDTRFAKLEAAMRDADRRIATLTQLQQDLAGQATMPAPEPPAETAVIEQDIRHQVVYELADAGMNPVQIAKQLGRTTGEVELILNLRRPARRSPTGF